MTRTMMTTIFAAAAMTAAAYGQELRANVPFDFVAGGKRLASGTYIVKQYQSGGVTPGYVLQSVATNQNAAIVIAQSKTGQSATRNPKLVFKCGSGDCALAEVHEPGREPQAIPTRAPKNGEKERMVAVALTTDRSAAGF